MASTSVAASLPSIPAQAAFRAHCQPPRSISMPMRVNCSSVSTSASPQNPPAGEGRRINRVEATCVPSSALTSRDPIVLPRPFACADPMEPAGDGLKVAYQVCAGAYSEAAAKKAYPSCRTVPCESFETSFQAVELRIADRAVLPLENSLGGSVHRNYDLLLQHRLHIVGEVQLAVRHCLLANRGVKIENLRTAMSHPQALAQCAQTLKKLGIEHMEAVNGTASAAKFIAEKKLQDKCAVASSLAAELYGLDILAQNIQDGTDNVTRFMTLAREPIIPCIDKPFKISIVFSLEGGPGQIFKALEVFSLRKINVTKMESRPHRKRPLHLSDDNGSVAPRKYFDYLFYLDLEASMADTNAQSAFANLKAFTTFLRVLGSYPTDVNGA